MDFRKPEEDDKGETFDNGRSPRETPPGGGSAPITEQTVEFAGDEVSVEEAISLASEMLTDPGAFGIATAERVRELEDENAELRKKVEQYESAIAELARATENLGQYQAEIGGSSFRSTIQLDSSAMGSLYTASMIPGLNDE